MKTIKRYNNRKLYDTEQMQYLAIGEIIDMVKNGVEFEIIEVSTKQEVTAVVLTHWLSQQEANAPAESELLKKIVKAGSFTGYVKQTEAKPGFFAKLFGRAA